MEMNIQILEHGKCSTAVWTLCTLWMGNDVLCVMSRNTWVTFTCISLTYAKEVTDLHLSLVQYWNSKTKCEPPRLSQPVSDVFWENKTIVTVSYYYRAKCEQLEWHTLKIRHTTQTQDPAKLICHIKFVNIHSKPCELCQVLEECSDLLLIWQAVQQDFLLRLTFMMKLFSKLPQKR